MDEKIKQHAETLISMSTEYLMGNYDEKLYVDMINIFGNIMKKNFSGNIQNYPIVG